MSPERSEVKEEISRKEKLLDRLGRINSLLESRQVSEEQIVRATLEAKFIELRLAWYPFQDAVSPATLVKYSELEIFMDSIPVGARYLRHFVEIPSGRKMIKVPRSVEIRESVFEEGEFTKVQIAVREAKLCKSKPGVTC